MNLDLLRQRAELLQKLRAFFYERGFIEVETPLLASETIPESHINLLGLADGERWLQASPEMHHKRLLCEGAGPIFEVTRSFRQGEQGAHHNPEFTIVEWYRPADDMLAGMDLLDELIQILFDAPKARRTSYREAFERVVGINPHVATLEQLRELLALEHAESMTDRNELLNMLLAIQIEPTLGQEAPELLYHYPASQAALATTTVDDAGAEVAERFEIYWQGLELANGYHELTDPVELQQRLVLANKQRLADGNAALPMPKKLLGAMTDPGLPPCSGVALGFDRLVMLASGADKIGDVQAFSEFIG